MEIKGATYLYTLATLMVTFAGFSALLLIIRQAAGGTLSATDRFLTRTVIVNVLFLTAGALLPMLLSFYQLSEPWIWKTCALLFGLPMLAVLLSFPHRRRAATGHSSPAVILAVFVGLGSAVLAAMIAVVFASPRLQAAAYISAVTINFFTLAFAFVVALEVILRQPADRAS